MNMLHEIISRDIREHQGIIPFARFMELALYTPKCGYYERRDHTPGRAGDFHTSVSVGSVLGELLAFQFAQWLEEEERTEHSSQKSEVSGKGVRGRRRIIAESGTHDGTLAADILNALRQFHPSLYESISFYIIEPSTRRQGWQKVVLAEHAGKVQWVPGITDLSPDGSFDGILYSNELLDAFPVHRLAWDAKAREWFEWGVSNGGDGFDWARMSQMTPSAAEACPDLPGEVLDVLPDGFITEVAPSAVAWWSQAAKSLKQGRLLMIDYGLDEEDFFAPHRANGTLRGYLRHEITENPLACPGDQDLTIHVNFTAMRNAGEAAGLKTEMDLHQGIFLSRIAARVEGSPGQFDPWTPARLRQFQTLIHPSHFGHSFRVLVQKGDKS